MNAWHRYFTLRRLGYAPHMAYLCAMAESYTTKSEYLRRLERLARRMNK